MLGKVTEQIIPSVTTWPMQDNWRNGCSQHGVVKGSSYLMSLISFYDRMTCLVDEGKAADVAYLNLSKAFVS